MTIIKIRPSRNVAIKTVRADLISADRSNWHLSYRRPTKTHPEKRNRKIQVRLIALDETGATAKRNVSITTANNSKRVRNGFGVDRGVDTESLNKLEAVKFNVARARNAIVEQAS
jgi:hypothetical protein